MKGKVFSIINICGLAMGLSACILIALFVADEFSYDQYNSKADRIFRVVYDVHLNGNAFVGNYAPPPMGPTLVAEYPPIEKAVRLKYEGDILVGKGNERVIESNAVLADSTLFDIFTLPMIAGDAGKALTAPYSMVISERIAKVFQQHGGCRQDPGHLRSSYLEGYGYHDLPDQRGHERYTGCFAFPF